MKVLILPLGLFLTGLGLLRATGADRAVADWCFDPVQQEFPWRSSLLMDRVMHRGARDTMVGLGVVALVLALFGRRTGRPSTREVARMVLLSLVLCTTAVGVLKSAVNRHCPWSYARYGGTVPDAGEGPLFRWSGHEAAFPAGHASGGFSLMVLWFAGRRRSAAAARAGLCVGLVAGTALGLSQVVRGAHFLSHNIWTAAICWYIAYGVDRCVPGDA